MCTYANRRYKLIMYPDEFTKLIGRLRESGKCRPRLCRKWIDFLFIGADRCRVLRRGIENKICLVLSISVHVYTPSRFIFEMLHRNDECACAGGKGPWGAISILQMSESPLWGRQTVTRPVKCVEPTSSSILYDNCRISVWSHIDGYFGFLNVYI